MKKSLSDDRWTGQAQPERVVVHLRDDPETLVDVEVLPTVTVRQRVPQGYDADGDPLFSWTTVVSDVAVLWEQRREMDDVAGVVDHLAVCQVLYDGNAAVSESAVVETSFENVWRVVSVRQLPDRLEFDLHRVDHG